MLPARTQKVVWVLVKSNFLLLVVLLTGSVTKVRCLFDEHFNCNNLHTNCNHCLSVCDTLEDWKVYVKV